MTMFCKMTEWADPGDGRFNALTMTVYNRLFAILTGPNVNYQQAGRIMARAFNL